MNADLVARIAGATADPANFGVTLAARHLTTVVVDAEGHLVEYRPGGCSGFV